jgi:hypothetical protein
MNNFDTSSSGVNLELTCERDNCLAQDQFSENFKRIDTGGSSLLNDRFFNADVYQFIDNGNFSDGFNLTDLNNYDLTSKTNKNILANIRSEFYGSSEDLRNDSLNLFNKYPYQLNKVELLELVENEFNEDYEKFLVDNFTPLFEIISIRGYSQGDYAEIAFTHKDIKEYNFEDREKFLVMMENYFTNLFYDAPIYCKLGIDQDEFDFREFMKNEFEYDKNELIAIAEKHIIHTEKQTILTFLNDNLSEYL